MPLHCGEARAALRAAGARALEAPRPPRGARPRARASRRCRARPAQHVARHRAALHQRLRELRASAARARVAPSGRARAAARRAALRAQGRRAAAGPERRRAPRGARGARRRAGGARPASARWRAATRSSTTARATSSRPPRRRARPGASGSSSATAAVRRDDPRTDPSTTTTSRPGAARPTRRPPRASRRSSSGWTPARPACARRWTSVREGRGLVEFCAGELDAVGAGLEELRLDELVARLEQRREPTLGAPPSRAPRTRIADLPLEIEDYGLERLAARRLRDFTRVSTVLRLRGGGDEGLGEDVTYDAEDHDVLQEAGAGAAARRQLDARVVLRPPRHAGPVARAAAPRGVASTTGCGRTSRPRSTSRCARPGLPLPEALGREARPLTFVVSLRLGEPADARAAARAPGPLPGLRFKLDPTPTGRRAGRRARRRPARVDSRRPQGPVQGLGRRQGRRPGALPARRRGVPAGVDRGPALTDETDRCSSPTATASRGTRNIHCGGGHRGLPFAPRMVNVKPSRLGGLRELLRAYDHCAEHGIAMYGGGQFELGAGPRPDPVPRGLFHPDSPNDVAPGGYNDVEPAGGPARQSLAGPGPSDGLPLGLRAGALSRRRLRSGGGGRRCRGLTGSPARAAPGGDQAEGQDPEPDAHEQQGDAHDDREQRHVLREVGRVQRGASAVSLTTGCGPGWRPAAWSSGSIAAAFSLSVGLPLASR